MTDTSKEAMLALSLRFHEQISNIADGLDDEGDRVYLGSTNDADTLRDIAKTVQAVRWEKDEPPTDWIAVTRALRTELDSALAEIERLQQVVAQQHAIINVYEAAALKGLTND